MRLDLRVLVHRMQPRGRTHRGQFYDVTDACGDSCIDQCNLVVDLPRCGAVGKKKPIGATQGRPRD
jgi:hypothetical protein